MKNFNKILILLALATSYAVIPIVLRVPITHGPKFSPRNQVRMSDQEREKIIREVERQERALESEKRARALRVSPKAKAFQAD